MPHLTGRGAKVSVVGVLDRVLAAATGAPPPTASRELSGQQRRARQALRSECGARCAPIAQEIAVQQFAVQQFRGAQVVNCSTSPTSLIVQQISADWICLPQFGSSCPAKATDSQAGGRARYEIGCPSQGALSLPWLTPPLQASAAALPMRPLNQQGSAAAALPEPSAASKAQRSASAAIVRAAAPCARPSSHRVPTALPSKSTRGAPSCEARR